MWHYVIVCMRVTWRLRFLSDTPKDRGQCGFVTCGGNRTVPSWVGNLLGWHYFKTTWGGTHIVLIANVDIWDLHLQVLNDLSDQLLHKRVLLLQGWIICEDRHNSEPKGPGRTLWLPKVKKKGFSRWLITWVQSVSWKNSRIKNWWAHFWYLSSNIYSHEPWDALLHVIMQHLESWNKNRKCLHVCWSSDLMCDAAEHMPGPCHARQQCKTTGRASSGRLPQREVTTENKTTTTWPQISACATQQHLPRAAFVIFRSGRAS